MRCCAASVNEDFQSNAFMGAYCPIIFKFVYFSSKRET